MASPWVIKSVVFCRLDPGSMIEEASAHVSRSKKGIKSTEKQALEAQRDLKHSLGLGHKPNVVPKGKADINGDLRLIELGWHPVGGGAGKYVVLMGNSLQV